ncbi:MAG: DUF3352 domain-containing protein [Gemmataceae bacterium]
MNFYRYSHVVFACLILSNCAQVRAEAPPDPLRLVSNQTDLIIEMKSPRRLLETYMSFEPLKSLLELEPFQELYDSTNARRFYQLVTYFEKELGAKWPDLMDRLGGGGVVLSLKFGPNPPPALLVIQGKDEALLGQFKQLALRLVEQELARQESKERIEKRTYRDIETSQIGNEFNAATIGSTLLFANSEEALKSAIDLHRDSTKKSLAANPLIDEARKLIGHDPLAQLWLNMETVRKAPQAKDIFTLPRNENLLTVVFGGWLDIASRTPYLTAALYQEGKEAGYVMRMPRGREGSAEEISVHVPPADALGARPLLEPKNVLLSTSYYLDVGKFWENRAKLFNEKNRKEFEEFDKNSGRFLLGTPFSKLVTQLGPYQRFVAVHQGKSGYSITPRQNIPAFALVAEMRDSEKFGKAINPVLRAAGFLASTVGDLKLKLVEEKHGPYAVVGYRFPDDTKIKGFEKDFLFNFSPCFVSVGNQFVASSTIELAHELIDILEKEGKNAPASPSAIAVRSKVYGEGGAEYLEGIKDVLLAQTILDRAAAPESARGQVKAFLDWVRKLGVIQTEVTYGAQDFQYDIRLIPNK